MKSLVIALTLVMATHATAQIRVVDIVPSSNSNEVQQDSEPNLAVDPFNPLRMAASAFTPDPMGGALAPIYVSTDGGLTWSLNTIVPDNNVQYGTGDITMRFGGSSGILYTGILRGNDFLHLEMLRAADFTLTTPMLSLYDRFSEDQPYVQATTVLGGSGTGNDRVYVGNNHLSGAASATVDRSLDAATAAPPANFSNFVIETRATNGQDLPPIRPAIHPDGTVYAIFYRWVSGGTPNLLSDVVVVRADGWGGVATPFNALTDPSDGLAGRLVVTGVTVPFGTTIGQNRLVASNVSIAVDPRNSDVVYIAWADLVASDYTLHVRRSGDRGQNWSASDLLTITSATNPALAVNTRGAIGFLYQQLAGGTTWETHLRRSSTDGASWNDLILSSTPNATPVSTSNVYLGDYIHLMAVGKDFFGIFSAANMPVLANFPNGVQFLRNVDIGTGTLRDVTNTTTVNPSIDPFFFQVTETAPEEDYYVRDWTLSAASHDAGQEPSTYPWFYVDSDVWNQRTAAANAFNASDQPVNEDAGNDFGVLGDNFMFARVHRKGTGTAGTVNLHFLYANYGVGLNYQDANTMVTDPALVFGAASPAQSMATGFPWHLDPTTSTHLCLGVEITGPFDAFVPPSLAGSSPGWPTTDLRVISDNNKAQRNIHVLPTGTAAAGSVSGWAIAHNAATFPRDMILRYTIERDVLRRIGRATLQIAAGQTMNLEREGTIRLPKMQPGENRWLRVTFDGAKAPEGQTLPVQFVEMVGTTPINGFAIAPKVMPLPAVIRYDLDLHLAVFNRAAAILGGDVAAKEARAARALLNNGKRAVSEKEYAAFVRAHSGALRATLDRASKQAGWPPAEPGRLSGTQTATLAAAHLSALNDLDAVLTAVQLAGGDSADILQNVRWQQDLFRRVRGSEHVLDASSAFIDAYTHRKAGNADYPKLLASLIDSYRQTASQLQGKALFETIDAIEKHLDSPRAAQKAHRAFLLALQEMVSR
jgi:hypothetical protein